MVLFEMDLGSLSCLAILSPPGASSPPKLVSRQVFINVLIGQTIMLMCDINNPPDTACLVPAKVGIIAPVSATLPPAQFYLKSHKT